MLTEELEAALSAEYMDYMRMWSKRYLQRVRTCAITIAMVRSEMGELERSLDGVGAIDYSRDRVGGTPDDEGLLRRVERMDSLRAELREELDQNLQWQADAHRALSHVRQPWRAVLTYRYLEGMAWADVAERMGASGLNYSEDHIRKDMHDNGLVELFPHIPHEYDELPSERGMYDVSEAAGLLGVSRQRVHQLIQDGKLDAHKVGKTWYVYRHSVENRLRG